MAKTLAARGASVILCSRKLDSVSKVAGEIGATASAWELDVGDDNSVSGFVDKVAAKYPRIDVLVNAAGYPFDSKLWYKRFDELKVEEFQQVLNVDLLGTFRLSQKILAAMTEKGGGVIVNIASTPALSGHTDGVPYTVAKAGIIALTKCIALVGGSSNVRAYALALGNIATDATFKSVTQKDREEAENENAMQRWGRPTEVASAIASLASDDFTFCTGSTIVLDGGAVLL